MARFDLMRRMLGRIFVGNSPYLSNQNIFSSEKPRYRELVRKKIAKRRRKEEREKLILEAIFKENQ
tara:strand:- start:225 stop:422 length:198 start_codon:yes stop_codon:yes gene_type:complete